MIQVFGTRKSAETRKAQRFFAERRIQVHFVDLTQRAASPGELRRFVQKFGDENARLGYCLYKMGCKGPATHANCSVQHFGEVPDAWPIGIGHPCFGCTEQGVGFTKPIHSLANVLTVTPPTAFPRVAEERGHGATVGAAALAGAVLASRLGKRPVADDKAFARPSHDDQADSR